MRVARRRLQCPRKASRPSCHGGSRRRKPSPDRQCHEAERPADPGPTVVEEATNKLQAILAAQRQNRLNVEVLSDSPDIPLKDVLGQLMTVRNESRARRRDGGCRLTG
jgi:hypothetical protein